MMNNRLKLLAINLEPAPYKVDLYNAFARSHDWEPFVFYSHKKDFSLDAGHDFKELPEQYYDFAVVSGAGILSTLLGFGKLAKVFYTIRPDFTIVCGYSGIIPLLSIILLSVTGKPYALWADLFNLDPPRCGGMKAVLYRRIVRKLVFTTSSLVMMCGKAGRQSAVSAGCPPHKVIDFPYVVDAKRLRASQPEAVPTSCQKDLDDGKTVVLFSGRHIPRKGLPTLLEAASHIYNIGNWVLWIEGEGPQRRTFEDMADRLGLARQCRFLGFCQMRLHGWLVSHADIVVVPSDHDPWGIVVDEGMQLGKAVCASNATGSAIDRIRHGENGYLFEAGDSKKLSYILTDLIIRNDLRNAVARAALETAQPWSPYRNVQTISKAVSAIFKAHLRQSKVSSGTSTEC